MPLKITYKSPPYRDKVLTFDDSLEEIRIGRTHDTEVPFPEDMAIVGHDHFAIKREAGAYRFVINPNHRVYADGKDVYDGQAIAKPVEIRLGTTLGPRLLLEPAVDLRAHAAGSRHGGVGRQPGRQRQLCRSDSAEHQLYSQY